MLFYKRRTEGKRVPEKLNRSLSVSFEEEVKEGHRRFREPQHTNQSKMDIDSNRIDEEKEEVKDGEVSRM